MRAFGVGAVGFEPTRPCEPAVLETAVFTGFHHAPTQSERPIRIIVGGAFRLLPHSP
jgi:hypothetical protein